MFTKAISQALLVAFATWMLVCPAHAQNSTSALQELAQKGRPFHSRTCGLVLLSNGRAQVREAKAQGADALGPGRAQLINAFLLLRDGRNVQEGLQAPRDYFNQQLNTGPTTTPRFQALPAAIRHCEQWFETRRQQADFDQGPEALDSAKAQAEFPLQTE